MRLTCMFLSEQEKQRIHENSLTILSNVGVKFMSAKARQILAESGARVDKADMIVHIPPAMVEQALKTAPRSFVLGARNPIFDFAMPSRFTGYTLDGAATFAVDFESGERRPAGCLFRSPQKGKINIGSTAKEFLAGRRHRKTGRYPVPGRPGPGLTATAILLSWPMLQPHP